MICTANVCRSPLAEAVLKKMIKDDGLENEITVNSCGVWAADGQKSSAFTEEVAKENKLDLSHHRSQSLNPQLIRNSDLILCMTPEHRQDLLKLFPGAEDKIFTLKGFARTQPLENEVIGDPIGLSLNFYRRIFGEIESELKRILPDIKMRSGSKRV